MEYTIKLDADRYEKLLVTTGAPVNMEYGIALQNAADPRLHADMLLEYNVPVTLADPVTSSEYDGFGKYDAAGIEKFDA